MKKSALPKPLGRPPVVKVDMKQFIITEEGLKLQSQIDELIEEYDSARKYTTHYYYDKEDQKWVCSNTRKHA